MNHSFLTLFVACIVFQVLVPSLSWAHQVCDGAFDEVQKACSSKSVGSELPDYNPTKFIEPKGSGHCTTCQQAHQNSTRNSGMFKNASARCDAAVKKCVARCDEHARKHHDNTLTRATTGGDVPIPADIAALENIWKQQDLQSKRDCQEFAETVQHYSEQSKAYSANAALEKQCMTKQCTNEDPTDPKKAKDPADTTDTEGNKTAKKDSPESKSGNSSGNGSGSGSSNGSQGGSGGGKGGGMGDMLSALAPLAMMAMQQQQKESPTPQPPPQQQQENQFASYQAPAAAGCAAGQYTNSQGVCQSPPTQVGGVGANPTIAGGGPITPSVSGSSGDGYDGGGSPYQPMVAQGGNPMPGMEGARGGGGGGLSLSGGGGNGNAGFGGGNRAVGDGPQAAGLSAGGGSSGGGGGGGGGGGWGGGKTDSPGSSGFSFGFNGGKKDRMPASVKIFGKNVPVGRDGVTGPMGPPVWEKLGSAYKEDYMGNQFFNDP